MTNIFNTKDNADTMFSELLAKAKQVFLMILVPLHNFGKALIHPSIGELVI